VGPRRLCQDAAVTDERLEVTRTFAAEPAAIFAVLRDPLGHVEIDATGMLMDADGEPVSAVGDSFVVHMDREALNDYPLGKYDVEVKITTYEPDREIAWTVIGVIRPPMGHVYGYTLEPTEGGTLVTSYYDWSTVDPSWKDSGVFPVVGEPALRATLGILARTVIRRGRPSG
jgi:Polyketide cyclase / dehydrase and lipid transport